MKKYIFLLCLGALAYGGYYFADLKEYQQAIQLEGMAQSVMKGAFTRFAEKWDLSSEPNLFVDGAQIDEISQTLAAIKNDLGSCKALKAEGCVAAARTPGTEADFSFAGKEAVSCPFVVDCDNGKAHGLAIFFHENNAAKLFQFSLSLDREAAAEK